MKEIYQWMIISLVGISAFISLPIIKRNPKIKKAYEEAILSKKLYEIEEIMNMERKIREAIEREEKRRNAYFQLVLPPQYIIKYKNKRIYFAKKKKENFFGSIELPDINKDKKLEIIIKKEFGNTIIVFR